MTLSRNLISIALAAMLVLLAAAYPVSSQNQPQSIPAVRDRIEDVRTAIDDDEGLATDLGHQAEDMRAELAHLADQMIAASAAAQPIEASIADLERRIGTLDSEVTAREADIETRHRTMGSTLAALQRMAVRPPAALLVSPGDANDIVRTGLILRTVLPMLEAQAASLKIELDEITIARQELTAQRQSLTVARRELRNEQDRLADLGASKEQLLGSVMQHRASTRSRIDTQTSQIRDLEALLERLQRQAAAREAEPDSTDAEIFGLLRPATGARGKMAAPAQGTILHNFGDANPYGGTHRGVTFTTPPAALVVSPWDGKVVFAGPFQNFGLILIIDHGEGYHSLISGFAEVSTVVDQWVLAGEPVGTAPRGSREEDGNGENGGGSMGPTLYVELRENGSPINPLPWLAAHNDKVQG